MATTSTARRFSRLVRSLPESNCAAPAAMATSVSKVRVRVLTADHRQFEDERNLKMSHMAQTYPVEPAALFPTRSVALSDFDQNFVLRRYTTRMTYLQTTADADVPLLFRNLTLGLSRTLAELPALAGRLVKDNPARGTVRIKINDKPTVALSFNDLSSPAAEKKWKHGSYSELAASFFPAYALNDPILKPPRLVSEDIFDLDRAGDNGVPVLVAQANFIPGGLLLYVAFNHVAGDGIARRALMRSLAGNTAKISAGGIDNAASWSWKDYHWNRLPDTLEMDGALRHSVDGFFLPRNISRPSTPDISTSIWRMKPSQLASLKSTASTLSDVPDERISTMDAVCALMWQRYAVATNLRERGIKMSTLNFALNWRNRISKALPEDYIGNTWTIRHVLRDTDHIMDADVSSLARDVRSAIKSFVPAELAAYQTAVRTAPHVGLTSLRDGGHATMGPGDFFISDQTASSEPLDFGTGLGKVQRQRIVGKIGYICGFVTSRSEEDGAEVVMNIPPAASERLKQDDVWKPYAELVTEY